MIRTAMMETKREQEEAIKRLEEYFARETDAVRMERDVSEYLAKVRNFDVKDSSFELLTAHERMPDFKMTFTNPNFKNFLGAAGGGESGGISTTVRMKKNSIKAVFKKGDVFWVFSTAPENLELVANKPIKMEMMKFRVGTNGCTVETDMQFVGRRDMKGAPVSGEQVLNGLATMMESFESHGRKMPEQMNIMINNGVMARQ